MIDGFRCSCTGTSAETWKSNPLLDFHLSVSESTGTLLTERREAKAGGLFFVLSPISVGELSCSLMGSLHKHKNAGGENWDDFTFDQLTQTLYSIRDTFSVPLESALLHSLEVGVNIPLNYSPKRVFKSAICHKGRMFTPISRKNISMGVVCERTDYTIKLYDKGHQSRIAGSYILRYEVKLHRLRPLTAYGISTLADLLDGEKVGRLLEILIDRLREIVFFDFSYSTDKLSLNKRLAWERYSNPHYWAGLNRNRHYKVRRQYQQLIDKYGAKDGQQSFVEKVVKKWVELLGIHKQKNRRQFPRFRRWLSSRFSATISNLECMLENVASGDQQTNSFLKLKNGVVSLQWKGLQFRSEKLHKKVVRPYRNKGPPY